MTTKSELIAQCKKENPTLKAIVNDEEITLSVAEYEKACSDWADMRLAQIELEQTKAKAEIDKAALLTKLGITPNEAKLLLG